ALGRYDEAIAAYDRVLGIAPEHADALNNRGNTLFALKRFDEAIASLRAALTAKPGDADVLFNLGRALQEIDRHDTALAAFDAAIAVRPDNADTRYSRGNSLLKLERIADAIADYEQAFALAPDHPHAFDTLLRVKLDSCDWRAVADLAEQIPRRLADGKSRIHPLKLLYLPVSPAIHLQYARTWIGREIGRRQTTAPN